MSSFTGVWQIDIEKAVGTERWTNVYYVEAASQTVALDHGEAIANIEKSVHQTDVTIVAVRARPAGVVGAVGAIRGIQIQGTKLTNSPVLPFPVCVRVLFNSDNARPNVKYLHCSADVADIQSRTTYKAAMGSFFNTNYIGPLIALGYLRSSKGAAFTSIAASGVIANHQMRRGSKRKANPILTA